MKNLTILVAFVLQYSFSFSQAVYNITDFGAKADDKTNNTTAIQKAIDKCSANGGGRVVIPGGIFLSATIALKNNVTLYLAESAVLKGIASMDIYTRSAFIYASGQDQIGVTGPGKIYGQGENKVFGNIDPAKVVNENKGRPMAISFFKCKSVKLKEFSITNSASWDIKLKECEDITVDDINIRSKVVGNNDGIDIIDCQNVRLANSFFDCGDDAICFKSESKVGVKNVVVANCVITSQSNAIKFGTGSVGAFENVTVSNCTIYDTRLSGVAIEMVDGGIINRINISNITMHRVNGAVLVKLGKRKGGAGVLRNVAISNIIADGIGEWKADTTASYFKKTFDPRIGMSIVGVEGSIVQNVLLNNIYLQFAGGGTLDDAKRIMPDRAEAYPEYNNFGVTPAYGINVRHVDGIQLNGIRIEYIKRDDRPALFLEDVKNADINLLNANLSENAKALIRCKDVQYVYLHDAKPANVTTALYVNFEGKAEKITIMNNGCLKTNAVYNTSEFTSNKEIQIINAAQ